MDDLRRLAPSMTTPNALHTDEYCLTMSQTYWREGRNTPSTFELFVRGLPEDYGYMVAAGLNDAIAYLRQLQFSAAELEHLRQQRVDPLDPDSGPLYDPQFIEFLSRLRFSGDVWAVPEGTVVPAQTPLLRIDAPRIEATIIESALLATLGHQSAIATKAARITQAARGRPVWDFSLRRLSSSEASGPVARAAYLGGCAGTATVDAGRKLGIPTTGTMAHAFIQSYGEDREQEAFETWLRNNPKRGVLLVDTFEARRGIRRAIAASQATGIPIKALRLDSGDLAELAFYAREQLDAAGMQETKILASNDLDEYKIKELLDRGAPIDIFGCGTMLGNPGPMSIVYKTTEFEDEQGKTRRVMKLAPGKQTDPGRHMAYRLPDGSTYLALEGENPPAGAQPLMVKVMDKGRIVCDLGDLQAARERFRQELANLPEEAASVKAPGKLKLIRSQQLWELRRQLGDPQAAELAGDDLRRLRPLEQPEPERLTTVAS